MNIQRIFVDTSGWANFLISAEPFHARTNRLLRAIIEHNALVVTTNYVITELMALLDRPLRVPRPQQLALLDALRIAKWLTMIHIDEVLDEQAWKLCKSRPDKHWSLVDCASFVVMEHYHIYHALTADHHFQQAGFIRLLEPTSQS